jgi:hypothetical protein
MSKEIRDIFTDIGIAAVVLVIALPLLYKGGCEPKSEPKNDTIYIHDTIRIVEPTPTEEDVVGYDTASFPMVEELERNDKNESKCVEMSSVDEQNDSDSLDNPLSNDSAKVVIPITERTYEDSTYKAVVRGYNPELVSLDIYNSTRTITKTKQPKVVVGIGPYVGFGNKGFNYGVAVNVSMPIWSW